MLGRALFRTLFRLGRAEPVYTATARYYVADWTRFMAYPNMRQFLSDACRVFGQAAVDDLIKYFEVMPDTDIMSVMPQIQTPTLIVTGDSDPIVPPEQSYTMAQRVAGSKLVVLKKVGHFPFFESPSEYQAALADWLRE